MNPDTGMTLKQQVCLESMLAGENVFITGAGGVGKSYIIEKFISIKKSSRYIGVTSMTGISALLIHGATLHSFLGIGLGNGSVEAIQYKIQNNGFLRQRWTTLNTLIIDEISMMSHVLFDKLDSVARLIRGTMRPFGGIQLILSGDFCQLPCIGVENKLCIDAESWNKCIRKNNIVYLTHIIRQSDTIFQEFLNTVRMGIVNEFVVEILESRKNAVLSNEYGIIPTFIYTRRYNVAAHNNRELDILAEKGLEFFEYNMEINIEPHVKAKDYIIEKINNSTTAEKTLQLCVGAQVMLIKNLFDGRMANGSRGIVTGFMDVSCIPIVKFLNGEEIAINYTQWAYEENNRHLAMITQIPLKVAYAITVHAAQGSTLDYVSMDLSNVFEYGQAYVALSRVKNIEGLSIIDYNVTKIKALPAAVEFYSNL